MVELSGSQPSIEVSSARPDKWWRSAVIYQVYPRSFADGNGDGIGDIAGIRDRLPYLAGLGVDAIWINPWYPSPMKDAGYDVSDFRDVDPIFGTLEEATSLLAEAHELGLRVILDIVPNHTSDRHPWFQDALRSAPGSPARTRFHFRDGRGPDGSQPPTDWISDFGGTAWQRVTEADGSPGQWYLHLYAPEQPDLNWESADVRADFERTLRFWFDRGVDGFRIDVAHGLVKDPDMGDAADLSWPLPLLAGDDIEHPHWDRAGVHQIYRSWRSIADSYSPPRIFAGEVWVGRAHRLVRYVRSDELHSAFNFDYLTCPWRPALLRRTIDQTLDSHRTVNASPTWVLSNHDVPRVVSRYAREQPDHIVRLTLTDLLRQPADLQLGLRRARAAALLMLALPGSAYLYQGEELGLAEVEDIPEGQLQDPVYVQTGGADRGRDGCRVPLPWEGDRPPFGFSPSSATAWPWLPQPPDWAELTVDKQSRDNTSTLAFYRRALQLRRETPSLHSGAFSWTDSATDILALTREPDFCCLVNLSTGAIPLPANLSVMLSSTALDESGQLPPDTAVWLTAPRQQT